MKNSKKTIPNPKTTGGYGYHFEDAVIATYLSAFLRESHATGLQEGHKIVRIDLQQSPDQPLDDLIVYSQSKSGNNACLSLQVKTTILISSKNQDFIDIIINSHRTLETKDQNTNQIKKVGIAFQNINNHKSAADLKELCEWAASNDTPENFMKRFQYKGDKNPQKNILGYIKTILKSVVQPQQLEEKTHNLLRHFILLKFDLLHSGAVQEAQEIQLLQYALQPDHIDQAEMLWTHLIKIATRKAYDAATINRPMLLAKIPDTFHLKGAPSFQNDFLTLEELARNALNNINDKIGEVHIQRSCTGQIKEALVKHNLTYITGKPGTGKSAALKAVALMQNPPFLLLQSDRLEGTSWGTYAKTLGLHSIKLDELLLEIAKIGTPVLFIDGIDMIEARHRGVVIDFVNTILKSPHLKVSWKIVATCRNTNNQLPEWLPSDPWMESTCLTPITSFDDDEAPIIAEKTPLLRPLLFNKDTQIREMARRPFFTNMLAKLCVTKAITPLSEIELIQVWWDKGGYDSHTNRISRQQILIHLAKTGISTFGHRIKLNNPLLDSDIILQLEKDGIIQIINSGHSVKFTHDIFFEWACLHYFLDVEDDWIQEVLSANEPPSLRRIIELLSQGHYLLKNEQWGNTLTKLEQSPLSDQWGWTWLVAPFELSHFLSQSELITEAITKDRTRLLNLLTWIQKDKAKENFSIIDSSLTQSLTWLKKIELADAWEIPSNDAIFANVLKWLFKFQEITEIPTDLALQIISVFAVWQHAYFRIQNPISDKIIEVVQTWLYELEDVCHLNIPPEHYKVWAPLSYRERKKAIESLRKILIISAKNIPTKITQYLVRINTHLELRKDFFEDLLAYSSLFADGHAKELVDICLNQFKKELPEETVNRIRSSKHPVYHGGFSIFDREHLFTSSCQKSYIPSPIQEPFSSLFQKNPVEGIRLVKELTNHAITGWRQLYIYDRSRQANPISIELEFPWGKQIFWGDSHVYVWRQTHQCPEIVRSGLMALEEWAFSEIERGQCPDEVIQNILFGHDACAVLAIATIIAIHCQIVSYTTLPLVISSHLWLYDWHRWENYALSSVINFDEICHPKFNQTHWEAAQKIKKRSVNNLWMISLAQLFVFSTKEDLKAKATQGIRALPHHLPFEFEETKKNENNTSQLRQHFERWSTAAELCNYSVTAVEDKSKLLIEWHPPKPQNITDEQNDFSENKEGIIFWSDYWLKTGTLTDELKFKEALNWANSIEKTETIEQVLSRIINPSNNDPTAFTRDHNTLKAFTATAAVTLTFPANVSEENIAWAKKALFKVLPIKNEPPIHPQYTSPNHPSIFLIYGLVSIIKNHLPFPEAITELKAFAQNGCEEIALAAIYGMLNLWEIDPSFAWSAIESGIGRSLILREDIKSNAYFINSHNIPEWPDFWIPLPNNSELYYLNPNLAFNSEFLAKLLQKAPIDLILQHPTYQIQFIDFCKNMVHWTIKRVSPLNKIQENKLHLGQVPLWCMHLYRYVFDVSQYMEPLDFYQTFLNPVLILDDEQMLLFIGPFIEYITAIIIISPTIPTSAIALLTSCSHRIIKHQAWQKARIQAVDIIDSELIKLVNLIFFTNEGKGHDIIRFLNGSWPDLQQIHPLINQFMEDIGDIPTVISAYLKLCEKAIDIFPEESFLNVISDIFKKHNGIPASWKKIEIASKISILIEHFHESLLLKSTESRKKMTQINDLLATAGIRRAITLQKKLSKL